MKRNLSIGFTFLLSMSFVAAAQEKTPLKLVATIPLPGLKDGDFDHFAVDLDGHRLFLTAEENDKLGKEIAQKASAAKGPTAVLLPKRGVSAIDAEAP